MTKVIAFVFLRTNNMADIFSNREKRWNILDFYFARRGFFCLVFIRRLWSSHRESANTCKKLNKKNQAFQIMFIILAMDAITYNEMQTIRLASDKENKLSARFNGQIFMF